MTTGRYDPPTIWRGMIWPNITLVWKDLLGNPFDLTGWKPFAQTITGVSLNPQVTDPVNGVTTLGLTQALTAGIKIGSVSWDWIWQHGPLDKYPPSLRGIVTVKQPSTHEFT